MNRAVISDPGSRPWFEGYLKAFNARDYDGFAAFYAQDVAFRGQAIALGHGGLTPGARSPHGHGNGEEG